MALRVMIDLTCQDTDIFIIESEVNIAYEELSDIQIIGESSSHIERKSRMRQNKKGNRHYRKKKYEDLQDFQIIKDPYRKRE